MTFPHNGFPWQPLPGCVSLGLFTNSGGAFAVGRLARQSRRLLSREETGVGSFDGTRIDEQFATWPSHTHNPQPRVGGGPVPGCVKHSLHEPHAPENLDEELLGKHERAYAVDNDRFETLWLLQHAASVSAVWCRAAPAGAQSVGRRHPKSARNQQNESMWRARSARSWKDARTRT